MNPTSAKEKILKCYDFYIDRQVYLQNFKNDFYKSKSSFLSYSISLFKNDIDNDDYGHPFSMMIYYLESDGDILIPTYSYCRIYRTGASLTEHLDRRSSEYTLSITLEDNDNDKWPLSVEMYNHTVLETTLDVGDALLYSGRDQMHWRPGKYKGKEIVQAFIQYVDAEGDSTNFGWDGRPLLGMPFESTDPSLDHNMDRTLDEQSIINRRLDK